jgi:hypothetical protein
VTRETSFCGVTALVSSIYGGHASMHEVSSVISPSQALVLSSSHAALSRACVRGWIVVGPEGCILQCDMFAKMVERRLARQRQYCYSRRALVVGAASMDGWLEGSCLRQSASMSRGLVPRLTKRVIRAPVFSAAEEPRWQRLAFPRLAARSFHPHPAASTSQRHWPYGPFSASAVASLNTPANLARPRVLLRSEWRD